MNDVVKIFKKGHKIHIKESQKGTFTKWCGGNVTDECILRGKNSSNPKIRKKATFAANARKWKHKEGGIIKAQEGAQVKVDNNSKKLNLNSKLNFIGLMLPSILNIGSNSSLLSDNTFMTDTSSAMSNVALQYLLLLQQQALALNDLDSVLKSLYDPNNPNANGGNIVKDHYKWMVLAPQQALLKDLQKQLKELIDALNKLKKTNYITNALTNTLLTGLDLALNYKPTKKGSSVS